MNNKLQIKTSILLLVFILIVLATSGCSRVHLLDVETSRDEKAFREMLDKVFIALDKKDKEGLKALYARSAIKENSSIDEQIESFLKIYKGPLKIEHIQLSLHSEGSNEHGREKTEIDGGGENIVIVANNVRYYVYMQLCSLDDFNKDNMGIHTLEFDTEIAIKSKYFAGYNEIDDGPGFYYQESDKKRDDIKWIQDRSWKYKHYDRKLTTDMLRSVAEKNDDFSNFVAVVGKPNCSWTVYEYYYYELDNGLFAVCKLNDDVREDASGNVERPNSIVAIYVADERDNIETIWMADDIVKVYGEYRCFKPSNKELSEDFFRSFASRSHSLKQLINEIGPPNVDRVSNMQNYYYYKISDNRFVGFDYSGVDEIDSLFVVDSDNKLYTIWESKPSSN